MRIPIIRKEFASVKYHAWIWILTGILQSTHKEQHWSHNVCVYVQMKYVLLKDNGMHERLFVFVLLMAVAGYKGNKWKEIPTKKLLLFLIEIVFFSVNFFFSFKLHFFSSLQHVHLNCNFFFVVGQNMSQLKPLICRFSFSRYSQSAACGYECCGCSERLSVCLPACLAASVGYLEFVLMSIFSSAHLP